MDIFVSYASYGEMKQQSWFYFFSFNLVVCASMHAESQEFDWKINVAVPIVVGVCTTVGSKVLLDIVLSDEKEKQSRQARDKVEQDLKILWETFDLYKALYPDDAEKAREEMRPYFERYKKGDFSQFTRVIQK